MRFDLDVILIFLSEEYLNTEARQLDNDEDKEKNASNSISNFVTRSK
jgi:hypothetical protein